jgi:hypothetical protein
MKHEASRKRRVVRRMTLLCFRQTSRVAGGEPGNQKGPGRVETPEQALRRGRPLARGRTLLPAGEAFTARIAPALRRRAAGR